MRSVYLPLAPPPSPLSQRRVVHEVGLLVPRAAPTPVATQCSGLEVGLLVLRAPSPPCNGPPRRERYTVEDFTVACGPRNSRGRGRYWCSRPLFLTRACGPQGSLAQSRFRYPRPTGLSSCGRYWCSRPLRYWCPWPALEVEVLTGARGPLGSRARCRYWCPRPLLVSGDRGPRCPRGRSR